MAARIFIVEDEPNIAEALSFLLEREGYAVVTAADGDSAMPQLRAEPPAAVVLDVMLPKRSGFEVLKDIRSDPRLARLPVLVLTARGQSHDRRTAEGVGADAYLTKPFSNRDVVDAIRRLAGAAS